MTHNDDKGGPSGGRRIIHHDPDDECSCNAGGECDADTLIFDPRAILENEEKAWEQLGRTKPEGFYYKSLYDFVLREGQVFSFVRKPEKYGKAKMCFRNAWEMVWDNPDLTYVEGYYIDPVFPLPIAHAWTVTKDGEVIDPTLRWGGRYGRPRFGHGYIGVPFEADFVAGRLLEQKTFTLIDNWQANYPLLREKLPERAKRKIPA